MCVCAGRCECTHTWVHKHKEKRNPVCFSNLGDLCLEYCSVLGGISGNSQPYVLIFPFSLSLFFTLSLFLSLSLSLTHHTHRHTHLNMYPYAHGHFIALRYTCTHYFQLKGQGQEKSVCRLEAGEIFAIRQTV